LGGLKTGLDGCWTPFVLEAAKLNSTLMCLLHVLQCHTASIRLTRMQLTCHQDSEGNDSHIIMLLWP
jgi:hypothetical protein